MHQDNGEEMSEYDFRNLIPEHAIHSMDTPTSSSEPTQKFEALENEAG